MKKTNVLLSVMAAAGAGIIVGILLAPNSGARTRRRVINLGQDSLEDFMDTVEDSFDEFKGQTQRRFSDLKTQLKCGNERNFSAQSAQSQS
jgi:gas vesicle protein